jgi:hypothetical protein
MTDPVKEQSQWTLTYGYGDGKLTWNTNFSLWGPIPMLEPEPRTSIDASVVTFFADIGDALHLTANEKAEVRDTEGRRAEDCVLSEQIPLSEAKRRI